MTSTQTLVGDLQHSSPDPHPATEAIVTELRREPERYINEIVWLRAMNPAVDGQPTQRLMVVLSRKDEDSDVLVVEYKRHWAIFRDSSHPAAFQLCLLDFRDISGSRAVLAHPPQTRKRAACEDCPIRYIYQ